MALSVKPSASSVTKYVIPEHLRNDGNSNLLKFLEYYFKWMQAEGNPLDFLQNMLEYREFDVNPAMFEKLLTKQTANFIPANSTIDKQMVTAYIKDFYTSKGTLPSYEFVMNAIFGEHCSIINNSNKVFRASSNQTEREAYMFVNSTIAWNDSVIGTTITQTKPTLATARIENCVSVATSTGFINHLTISPETVIGTFTPDGEVQVLDKTVDRSWYFEEEYYTFDSYTPSTHKLVLWTTKEEKRQYPNLIVKQVNGDFRAVVTTLLSREIISNKIKLTFEVRSATGTPLQNQQMYIIPQSIEFTHYTIGKLLKGTVSPTIGRLDIIHGGAMHDVGEHLEYYGGTGTPFTADVYDIGGSRIDEIKVYQGGYGFSVGDDVLVDNSTSKGTGLVAKVSAIDGVDATLAPIMELDAVQVVNGGEGYSVNDIVVIEDGDNTPIQLKVATISPDHDLKAVKVTNVGHGYVYAKVMAYQTGTFTPIAETVSFSPVVNAGMVIAVGCNEVNLVTANVSLTINGTGATATCALTGDAISTVTVGLSGINYVSPVAVAVPTNGVGRGALFSITKDASGRITAINVVNGGYGYTAAPTIVIREMYGEGATIVPVIKNDSTVATLTIEKRGEFRTIAHTYNVLPTNKLVSQTGTGLTLNLKYRIKRVELASAGMFYRQVAIDSSQGLGHGCVIEPVIVDGVIKTIAVGTGGTGYTKAHVSITGSGTGFKGLVSISGGAVQTISIIDGGIGYSAGDTVVITGDGINAAASLTIKNGVVKQMFVHNGGSGYPYDTTVSFQMNPAVVGAIAGVFTPVIDSQGIIKSITVTDGGEGYQILTSHLLAENTNNLTTEDGIQISFDYPYDSVIVSSGTPAIITSEVTGKGGLLNVDVLNGGEGYYSTTEVAPLSITVASSTGRGATIIPVIENGSIVKANVIHGGSGYANTDTIVVTGTGNGATFSPVFLAGKLIDLHITNGGAGYQYGTAVHVIGNGSGAIVHANVFTGISSIDVTNAGHTYSNPSYTLTDATGTGAVLRLVVSEDGRIAGVIVLEGGSGYTAPTLTLTDATGAGATFKVNVTRNIESFSIIQQGTGYSSGRLLIIGDGINAEGSCEFENNGSIGNVRTVYSGTGYIRVPNIQVKDISNYGAISKVKVLDGGDNYTSFPIVSVPPKYNGNQLIASGAEIASFGKNVGTIRGVEFKSFGASWDEIPKIKFPMHVIVDENSNFSIGEVVHVDRFPYKPVDPVFDILTEAGEIIIFEYRGDSLEFLSENGDNICEESVGDLEQEFDTIVQDVGPSATVYGVDYARRIVELMNVTDELYYVTERGDTLVSENNLTLIDEASNAIRVGDTIIGQESNSHATITWFSQASAIAVQTGIGFTLKKSVDDVGVLNHPNSLIHNSERIQDFAYVVRSGLSFNDYVNQLTELVHPAGYKMYGDVFINTFTNLPKISIPSTYGTSQGDSAISVNLAISTEAVMFDTNKMKSLWFYNTTLSKWHTTYGGIFANFTFNNFDRTHVDFVSSIEKLTDIEITVAKSWFDYAATTVASSDVVSAVTTAGINIGYRVIAYDTNNTPIFKENKLLLEDGFALLDEEVTPNNLCTYEQLVTVTQIIDGTSFRMSKNANVSATDISVAVQNTPDLGLA